MILNSIKLHPTGRIIMVNNGEIDSWYEITDGRNETVSIECNVMYIDCINIKRYFNGSGLRIYDTGSRAAEV